MQAIDPSGEIQHCIFGEADMAGVTGVAGVANVADYRSILLHIHSLGELRR